MATQKKTTPAQRSTLSHLLGAVSASAQWVEVVAVRGSNTTEKLFDLTDEAIDASAKGVRSIQFT